MGGPARVAAVIGRALDSWLPRARYVVDLDTHAAVIADRFTPTAVKDIVSRFGFRISHRGRRGSVAIAAGYRTATSIQTRR